MMKTIPSSHLLYLCLVLSVLTTCHLEEIAPLAPTVSRCVTNLPVASFDIDVVNCDQPCTVVVTNTSSSNSIGYQWFFGDNTPAITNPTPPNKVYVTPGQYEIMLVVRNTEDCTDTLRRTVTVGEGKVVFKAVLNTGNLNATPYALAEIQSGKFHVLYDQAGPKSAFVNRTGQIEGTPTAIAANMSINQAIAYHGGFVLSGEKSPKAKITLINADRVIGLQPEFQFPGASASLAVTSMVNQNAEIVAAGYKVASNGDFIPGFARYSQDGTQLANQDIAFAGTSGYGGASIAQRPNGNYLFTAFCLTGACAVPCVVFSVTGNGGYNGKFDLPLTEVVSMVQLSGDNFVVLGYSGSTPKVVGINGSGSVLWNKSVSCTEVAGVVATADGNLVVCGSKQNALYYAKLPASNTTLPIWEKTVAEAASTIYAYALIGTSDGGYAIVGQMEMAGIQKLYLVKTDDKGDYQ